MKKITLINTEMISHVVVSIDEQYSIYNKALFLPKERYLLFFKIDPGFYYLGDSSRPVSNWINKVTDEQYKKLKIKDKSIDLVNDDWMNKCELGDELVWKPHLNIFVSGKSIQTIWFETVEEIDEFVENNFKNLKIYRK